MRAAAGAVQCSGLIHSLYPSAELDELDRKNKKTSKTLSVMFNQRLAKKALGLGKKMEESESEDEEEVKEDSGEYQQQQHMISAPTGSAADYTDSRLLPRRLCAGHRPARDLSPRLL